jgi:hypothetical protein
MPPSIMLEEQSSIGYHRSIFFNISRTDRKGNGEVLLPLIKPYTTWLVTGFALNPLPPAADPKELKIKIRTLFEMAFLQHDEISPALDKKICEAISKRKLTAMPKDSSRYVKAMDNKMTFKIN